MVVEAERAKKGAVSATKVGAEMGSSLLTVGEACDYSRSEGIVINHGCLLLKLYSFF